MSHSLTIPSFSTQPTAANRTGDMGVVRFAKRGISLAELMIVIGIIAILSVLALAAVSNARRTANSVVCLQHLKAIQVAFLQYATDNGDRYPPTRDVAKRSWEMLLSPDIGPVGAFQCPSDSEIFPQEGSSYDWRDTGDSATTLAGKHVGGAIRGNAVLAYETLPNWHNKAKMNAVLIDGRCITMDADACLVDLTKPVGTAKPNPSP
jgi:prepilin-type N-terminal cleavage/methylation domain-containing protein